MSELDTLTEIHKRVQHIDTTLSILKDRKKTKLRILKNFNISTRKQAKVLRKKLKEELAEKRSRQYELKDEILGYLNKFEDESDEY